MFYDDNINCCQPCSAEGKTIRVHLFCEDCQDYLCQKCSTYHKALKVTQNHVLVTIKQPVVPRDRCSKKCNTHTDKSIAYFCKDHSCLGCSTCITMDHKQCGAVDHIPEVAASKQSQADFKKYQVDLQNLEDACKASVYDVEEKLKVLLTDEYQLKDAINLARKQMIDVFDNLERVLMRKARTIIEEETRKLKALSKKIARPLDDIGALQKRLDKLLSRGRNCDAYVMITDGAKKMDSVKNLFINEARDQLYKRFEFLPNKNVQKGDAFGALNCRTESVLRKDLDMSFLFPFIDGPAMTKLLKAGTRVRRGKDWKWDNQDRGGLGTIIGPDVTGWYQVIWDSGTRNRYRMGAHNAYDLCTA